MSHPRVRSPYLLLGYLLAGLPAEGLTIYRFGGQDREPPAEMGQPGVDFVQRSWEDLDPDAGGRAEDTDVSARTIGALQRDPGVNVAPMAENLGGRYVGGTLNAQVWDGDTSTVWTAAAYRCSELQAYWNHCFDDFGNPGTANIQLPGLFELDRVRIISGLRNPGRTVESVRVFVGAEEPLFLGSQTRPPHWHPHPFMPYLTEVRDNREQILDIPLPPNGGVGFLQVSLGEHAEDWEVHDIHVFAKGFASRSRYLSNIIDFGRPMAWGDVRWSGAKGDGARVQVQTRSGTDSDPVRYWRNSGRGDEKLEVTAGEYAQLLVGQKGGTSYDRRGWSFWSVFDFGDSLGAQVVSPSPRRYFQFRVDILPGNGQGGQIEFLELRASAPLVTDLIGEVWPAQATAGAWTAFTYTLKPRILAADEGFDRIEIRSEALLGGIGQVRVGDVPVAFAVVRQEPHHVTLDLPPIQTADSGALVQVDFEARILRYGTVIDVRVADSLRPIEVPQSVNAGDATDAFEGNTVSVTTGTRQRQLLQVRVRPSVLTPNGDGVNDDALLTFDILEVTGSTRVQVEIRDLAGRVVRKLLDDVQGTGTYERRWDGRDEEGRLLPPGVYLAVVSADIDRSPSTQVRALHLAY